MSDHNYSSNNPGLNASPSTDYTLLVKIGVDAFSYAIADQDKVILLKEGVTLVELAEPSVENGVLATGYKKCIVGLPDTGFTFIPLSLFNPEKAADFARFLDVKPDEKVFSQPLDTENQVIFKVKSSIADIVDSKFNLDNVVFAPAGWIKLTAANYPDNQRLYVNVDGDHAEILNFRNGKLRFYNSFEFKNADELAYFIVVVTGELGLQPQDITILLSGGITPEDINGTRLAQFFGKVELNYMSTLTLPDRAPAHQLLTLTALSLCGSSEVV